MGKITARRDYSAYQLGLPAKKTAAASGSKAPSSSNRTTECQGRLAVPAASSNSEIRPPPLMECELQYLNRHEGRHWWCRKMYAGHWTPACPVLVPAEYVIKIPAD